MLGFPSSRHFFTTILVLELLYVLEINLIWSWIVLRTLYGKHIEIHIEIHPMSHFKMVASKLHC